MGKGDGNSSSATGGIGFVGVLQVAFIVLKLIGKISWSWFWVLSPTWISIATALFVIIVVVGIIGWLNGR